MGVDGRFTVIESPQALPGHCATCGKPKDNIGFIDTDLSFEFFGALIYCSECVYDMASKFGFIRPDVAEHLNGQVTELQQELASHRAAILGLEEAIDGLLKVRDSGVSHITTDPEPEPTIEPETPTVPPQEVGEVHRSEISEEPSNDITDGDSEINDDIGEQVPVGVSSNFSDLPEFEF